MSQMSLKLLKNDLHKFYLLKVLYIFAISFTKITYIPFLKDKGLSFSEIHLLLGTFAFCAIIFEIPTSFFGERFGPKKSLLLGAFFKAMSAIVFYIGTNYQIFVIAEVLSAIGISFLSGCLDSWIVSSIKSKKDFQESSLAQVFVFSDRLQKVFLATSGLIGGYVSEINMALPWVLVSTGFFLLFICTYILISNSNDYKNLKLKNFDWLKGYKLVFQNRIIMLMVFQSFLFGFAFVSPKMFYFPYIKEFFGKDMKFIGQLWFLLAGVQFIGTFGIRKLIVKSGSALKLKFYTTLFSIICFGITIFFKSHIFIFSLFYFLMELAKPYHESLENTLIGENTESEGRITILSFDNFMGKLGSSLGLSIAGLLSIADDPVRFWIIGLVTLFFALPFYFKLFKTTK